MMSSSTPLVSSSWRSRLRVIMVGREVGGIFLRDKKEPLLSVVCVSVTCHSLIDATMN